MAQEAVLEADLAAQGLIPLAAVAVDAAAEAAEGAPWTSTLMCSLLE